MEFAKIKFTQEKLRKLFKILEIPFREWDGELTLGKTEMSLLSNDILKELADTTCLLGSDGTTAKVSKNEARSPVLVSSSVVLWGIEENKTKTYKYDQRLVIDGYDRLSHSTLRTILEIRLALCVLITRKLKTTMCKDCPINNYGCQWQGKKFEPWKHFSGKQMVAIFDLPVIFAFIRSLSTLDAENRTFLLDNLKSSFADIRKYELPVIFVSQKSTLKNVIEDISSELDEVINSVDAKAKEVINIIKEKKVSHQGLPILVKISDKMKERFFTDYELLEEWMKYIATPSPVFNVKPSEYNDNWDQLKFHYFTWGYQEYYDGKWIYFPSTWIRIGYSPALSPTKAHLLMCMDMILGKGHSISLTMAHTACNLYKKSYCKLLVEHYNKKRPDQYKLGKSIKDLNKWRLMKNV